MKSSVEPLEGNKVKLSIEVDENEFDDAIDAAFRKIAHHVKIAGFRPGKAPRQLVQARVGLQAARDEALHDALPDFYARAVEENSLEPIAPPEIDITAGKEEGGVAFDAVVEVMPEVQLGGYEHLRVVLPSFAVDETDIDGQLDRLRNQFAELTSVSRPAKDGDHLSMSRKVYQHGEVAMAADDELYEVGSGQVGPELDENLRGARAGDILKFNLHHEQVGEVTFEILVKDVQEKVLPDVTDEWAREASEFENVTELRHAIRDQIEAVRKLEASLSVRDKAVEALVELVDEEMPESLVGGEVQRRMELLGHQLGHRGIELDEYLASSGQGAEELLAGIRAEAEMAVKADVALRSVADRVGVEVTDDDIEMEVQAQAARRKRKPEAVRRDFESQGQWPAVRSGIKKTKTLEWLIGHTEFIDEEGQVIDREALAPSDAPSDADPQETPG